MRLRDCCKRITRKNKAGISLVLTASGEFGLVDQKEFFNKQVAPTNLSRYYHLKKGEFAYNRSSMKGYPYGAIKKLVRYEDGVLSTLYLCFKVTNSNVDPCFMEHLFESSLLDLELQPIARVGARAHGLLNVTPSEFMDIQLCLPPLPEQKRIAAILSSVDETIQATRETIEQTKKVKQGLMQELLTRGIGHTRFKKTELGEIPKNWVSASIQSVAAPRKNSISDGPFGSNLKSIHYRETGVPVIQSGFVTKGVFEARSYVYIERAHFDSNRRSRVIPGDIVMAKIGAQAGRCAILPSGHPESILAGNCMKITVNEDSCLSRYLLYFLQYRYLQNHLADVKSTTAQPAITLSRLKKMRLPLPPREEQLRIVSILNTVESRIQIEESHHEHLRCLKKGLMQDLLTGKVRVAV